MVHDPLSDPREAIDLMQSDLATDWVVGAATRHPAVFQTSVAEFRKVDVGEEHFEGYD
jgi:hypothetical protein